MLPFPAFAVIDPFPQLQVARKLALLVVKLNVRLIRLLLGLHRAVAHILHAQSRSNHQHFVERTAAARFQNHAAHARVQRQFGEFLAHRRQLVGRIHGAKFGQQLIAVSNRATRGSFDKRELFDHAQVQRLHAQDHAGQ